MSTQQLQDVPVQVAAPKNGLATAGLVCGIIGLVFSFIPVFGLFVCIPLALLALAFGGVGLAKSRKAGTGKGKSIAALVMGVASFVVGIVLATAVYNATDDALNDPAVTGTTTADVSDTSEKPAASIGQAARDGKFSFTITGITYASSVGPSMLAEEAKGRFALVHVTVKNIGDESQILDDSSQFLYDADGKKYSADSVADIAITSGKNSTWFEQVNPGTKVDGVIAFDLPKNVKPVRAELHDSAFSGGVTVTLN